MVNTRRSESVGSTPVSPSRLRPTRSSAIGAEAASSSLTESPSEVSNAEDTRWGSRRQKKTLPRKKKLTIPTRVRELRTRYGYGNLKTYQSSLRGNKNLDSDLPLNERRRLEVYSSRKMQDDSDSSNENYQAEVYSVRNRRPRHLPHIPQNMSRIQRRTALSLRPISQKSYADALSPLHFNSDSEGAGVRRSKRKRKVQFERSWLADDQMHKMGYPNLNTPAYSEEDSRDAQETSRDNMEEERRITRHSNMNNNKNRDVKNSKYVFDYDGTERHLRRRRIDPSLSERNARELRSRRGSNDKDKEENTILARLRTKAPQTMKEETNDSTSNDIQENGKTNDNDEEEENHVPEKPKDDENNKDDNSSQSEEAPRIRTRTRANNAINRNFPADATGKASSSSSEEDNRILNNLKIVRKNYSLRDRPPKPPPSKSRKSVLMTREFAPPRRRRFTRIRHTGDTSSSSSDSDVCIMDKYSKTPKSPHSKNEQRIKSGAGSSKIIPIAPETLDTKVRFSSIGGLDSHIQCLKEMILLPMMYPEVFEQFQIKPPRGVLFHGPPGTGKTLIARALANECSFGQRKVSFFMRKGADLLSKWVGESEKQLRQLFEQASEMKPSIIFFDELDGLAPVRSSRQDQVHASIVSTLLALMDGLDDRGEVIVIGATNRIDSIDPALRRPGRFDRELYFSLPARKDREEILNVHVSQWKKPPNAQLITYLAEQAIGYCGSDLRALCSEAVIQSFRRTYPQVYNSEFRLLLNPENVNVKKLDFMRAKSVLIPASHRVSQCIGKKLLPELEPLLGESLKNVFSMLENVFPHGVHQKLAKVKLSANIKPAQILLVGEGVEHGQTTHLAPAILYHMEHIQCYNLDLTTLYRESGRLPEEATLQVFNEARRNVPSVIFIPSIEQWWKLVSEPTRAILFSQLAQLDPHVPILILATSDTAYKHLPDQVQRLFSKYRKEVYPIKPPSIELRRAFLKPLIIDTCLKPPRMARQRPITPPPLPRAPTPPPRLFDEQQIRKIFLQEEHVLRELRLFLRDMCRKIANNKQYYIFTKPVDTEEVPDYTNIIKQPMDLETMMMKVDFHRYECAKDFLTDIELICKNALEYNPAKSSVDKQIRHRACSLRDYAYTLIKNEMDTDFEDKCQTIAKVRSERKTTVTKVLPDYIITPDNMAFNDGDHREEENVKTEIANNKTTPKKRRAGSWQRGYLRANKRRRRPKPVGVDNAQDDSVISQNDDSGEESKENNPDLDDSQIEKDSSLVVEENVIKTEANNVDVAHSRALTINTDTAPLKMEYNHCLQSPRRRLSDIMSPSELLDDPLEFDDVDQALNEIAEEHPCSKIPIECSQQELELVLEQAAKLTSGYTVQSLLDLYNQFSKIIKKFLRTHHRMHLPKELHKELCRFKKEESIDILSDSSQSSLNSGFR